MTGVQTCALPILGGVGSCTGCTTGLGASVARLGKCSVMAASVFCGVGRLSGAVFATDSGAVAGVATGVASGVVSNCFFLRLNNPSMAMVS